MASAVWVQLPPFAQHAQKQRVSVVFVLHVVANAGVEKSRRYTRRDVSRVLVDGVGAENKER